MDTGGENSSSHQASPVDFSWAPATPAKPSSSNGKLIYENGNEIRLERASIEETRRLLDSSVATERSFSCWESGLGSKSQDYDINAAGKYNGFSMNNVEMWNSMPCTDLLALADAAVAAKDCCGGGGSSSHLGGCAGGREEERSFSTSFSIGPDIEQYGRPNGSRYLFDLNSPPRTVTEVPSITGLPSQFTPVTPDQPRSAEKRQVASDNQENERPNHEEQPQLIIELSHNSISTLMSGNQNAKKGLVEEINLNKTPQPKQRRRKHRPKVVIEGETKGSKRSMTPRTDGSSTAKRKYVRKKQVDKYADVTNMEEVSENSNLSTVRETRSSCRRKINFDEDLSCIQEQNLCTGVQSTLQPGQGGKMMVETTQAELTFDKSSSMNDVVENHPAVLESQAPSPITPNKTEIPHERPTKDSKDTCTGAKCHINFSQDTYDKDASAMSSPNESNCSTSACLNKGKEAWGSKQDRLSDIDGMERCSQKVIGVRDDPVEAYLSRFTDYGLHFPMIVKKRRTEKYHGSVKPTTVSSVWSAEAYNCSFSAAPSASKAPETVNGLKDDQHSYRHTLAFIHMEHFKRKRTKGLTRMRDSSSFARIIEGNWWPSPKVASGYEASHQGHTCMEALAADFRVSIATKKRTKRNSVAPSYLYHNHQFLTNQTGVYPGSKRKIIYDIDALIKQFEHLDINSRMSEQDRHALIPYLTRYQEKNALVLYQRDGSLVPFEGFYPERRRKPRPKVDLDDETTRVWRLLLENIDSQGIDGTDEDKAKWWEEERRVFRGRADSFIARMHLVQGDRRFSQWKGSVVDSVIGVFLTQNVSDHLSSSAFMSLAARYPLKPKSSNELLHEETASISIQEPCHVDLNKIIDWHQEKSDRPARDHGSVTQQDAGSCEEREIENSNEVSKSSATMVGLIDKSVCESPEISEKDLGKYKQSVVDTSYTRISRTVASSTGDRREINDLVSSHDYVDTPPNSEQLSIALTAERLGSCSGEDLIGSKSNILGGATFVELLHKQEPSMSHILHRQEKSNGSANNNNLQDESEGMTYSQEQNEGIPHGRNSPSPLVISPKDCDLQMAPTSGGPGAEYFALKEESKFFQKTSEDKCTSQQSGLSAESTSQTTVQVIRIKSSQEAPKSCTILQTERQEILHPGMMADIPNSNIKQHACGNYCKVQQVLDTINFSAEIPEVTESNNILENSRKTAYKIVESNLNDHGNLPNTVNDMDEGSSKAKRGRYGKAKKMDIEWDSLRKLAQVNYKRERTPDRVDSLDYEAVRCADVNEIADTIKERGMNNMLAERIKDFLNRLVRDHGSIDLEWLRDVPPDKAKEYLLSFRGLGLKSVECVRLLTLHHLAFPVDTNVGRIAVRLGWVPLQPLPESLQLHLLELYPVLESIQKYLWPRLCKLDQRTLYELHYQMITFGKVFCTKSKPNCNSCPMRGECRHFASAFASARFALPAPEEKGIVSSMESKTYDPHQTGVINKQHLTPAPPVRPLQIQSRAGNCDSVTEEPATLEPVVEEPATPEPKVDLPATPESGHIQQETFDIEDFCEDPEEIPTIKLNMEEFTQNLQTYMEKNMELGEGEMSKALVALTSEAASIPTPKLKNVSQLRTEHHVYELPDSHPLLEGLDKREPDDPCSYLLAIWTPGETADSIQPPGRQCSSQEPGSLCNEETCFACNSIREANSQTVRGTLLIPCRTAMRGSFPLNGTYFQVNEVFADHDSSLNPIDVPRSWLWNLPRRTVYFGTSIPTIFKGLTTESIQYCFWRGFVCVRGFDQKTRAPRPLMARLHFPASKLKRSRGNTDQN